MARKQKLASFEDRVAAQWLEDAEKVADAIAAESGPPPGGDFASEPESVRLYGQVDQAVDYDQLLEMIQTTGVPEEILQTLQIAKERPEWAPLYQQPQQDQTMAQYLATFAEYPYRPALVLDYSESPEEQVRRDNVLYRAWVKTLAEQDARADEMLAGQAATPTPSTPPIMEPLTSPVAPPAPPMPAPPAAPAVPPVEGVPNVQSPSAVPNFPG